MRRAAVTLVAAVLAVLALAGSTAARAVEDSRAVLTAANGIEGPTVARINEVRRERGLRPLTLSRRLEQAAEAHAVSMGRLGFFTHESADGTVFWKRIERYYSSKGFRRWTVGENLLWASPDVTPEEAVEMWLASPGHRRILLSDAWNEVGLSAVHVTSASGVYEGLDVTIVAADFGARS